MPALDFASLSLLAFTSLVLMAIALPFAMGKQAISPAARHAQFYFLLQASAWACILTASRQRGSPLDMLFSCLSTLAIAGAQWNMAQALRIWLGPRAWMRGLLLICIAGPLGFALLWGNIGFRFAWFSTLQALGLLVLAHMCLFPQQPATRGWRVVLCTCALSVAALLLARAGLALWWPQLLPAFATESWINHGFVMLAHTASILTLVSVMVAWREESQQQLQVLASTDMLTNIANRRAFEAQATIYLEQARRQRRPIAMLLMDLDHFKQVNDSYGHAVGDQALQLFARTVQSQLRAGDLLARWGGEEFCLLVDADTSAMETLFQRLRQTVLEQAQKELGFALRFSAGCARPCGPHDTLITLVQRADAALYQAKQAGRDQMVCAEDAPTATVAPHISTVHEGARDSAAIATPPFLADCPPGSVNRHHTTQD